MIALVSWRSEVCGYAASWLGENHRIGPSDHFSSSLGVDIVDGWPWKPGNVLEEANARDFVSGCVGQQ